MFVYSQFFLQNNRTKLLIHFNHMQITPDKNNGTILITAFKGVTTLVYKFCFGCSKMTYLNNLQSLKSKLIHCRIFILNEKDIKFSYCYSGLQLKSWNSLKVKPSLCTSFVFGSLYVDTQNRGKVCWFDWKNDIIGYNWTFYAFSICN